MSIRGIDNIGVAVRDLDAVSQFFKVGLGLQVERQDGETRAATVHVGDRYLYVFETRGDASPPRDASLTANPAGIDHISFTVEDIDAAYAELLGRGVPFEGQPEEVAEWGLRLVGFRDPEGNAYYLVQPL